ncbi:MAG: extracellular solute-binding protein [Microgenomates group bacterium]
MDEEKENLPPSFFQASSEPATETPTPPPVPEEPKPNFFKKLLPFVFGILFIVIVGFLVFKIALPRVQKPKEIALTYWGLWEPEPVMNGIISEWEKNHPQIKIKYTQQSHREYRERLQSALARGEGPDIFRFHITWGPMFKNELEPMPPSVMSAAQYEQTFYPVVIENLRSGTSYLGIPLMVDTLGLYYNEDIFQAAGKTPPTTWEELRELATELTVKDETGRIQTAGVALGITANVDHWSDILGLMMLQNGADLTNPDACTKQAGEEVCLGADALTFYSIFSRTDHVWDETLPSSTQAFAAGKLAMYFGPSWRVFDIKAINPNLNFKIVPVPQLPGTNISWATFWVEGVAKRSKYKTEAWEFLKFLSSPQALEKLYQAQSNLRLFGEIYPRKEMAQKLQSNPLVAPFVNQMAQAKTWYLSSFTWDNGINDRMIKYFEDAVNAVNAGKTAKEALQTTTQGVSQLLSQYGIATPVVR